MIQTRTLVGLCMLCALALSAFAAQSASASKGTTAFTCVTDVGGPLKGEHCLTEGSGAASKHVAIAQDTTTETIATNEKTKNNTTESTPTKLKMTIAGVATEMEATALHGEGWMENKVEPEPVGKGEHYVINHGTITYTNVKVAKPAGLGCKVFTSNENTTKGEEGIVHTTPLKGTTTGEGENTKIEPTVAGGAFMHFIIEGCSNPVTALNGQYTVTGSVTCPINGATFTCSHAATTAAGTLIVDSPIGALKAGIEGAMTLKGRVKGSGSAYTPLSATTVETT